MLGVGCAGYLLVGLRLWVVTLFGFLYDCLCYGSVLVIFACFRVLCIGVGGLDFCGVFI